MSKLKTFKNAEFGNLRTLEIDNEPWFAGKDVAQVLGYQNGSRDINRHVDDEDRRYYRIGTPSGEQEAIIINESGLYSLILSSKLPTAKRFKRWVTSEVLPAIRKHGAYMTDEKAADVVTNPDGLASLLEQAAQQLKEKDIEIKRMKPKEIFADAITASDTSILVGDLAKILRGNGINIGQHRLFNWLRGNGFLIKGNRSDRNMPTQKSMELGLFEIKESSFLDGNISPNM